MFLRIFFLVAICFASTSAFAEATVVSQKVTSDSSSTIGDSAVSMNGPLYIVSNGEVETIDFPNLEFVNGPIYIVANANLKTVRFPKLSFVNGPIYISYNSNLETADFMTGMFVNGPVFYYFNRTGSY